MKKKNKNVALILLLALLAIAIIYCIYVSTANMIDCIGTLKDLSKNEVVDWITKESELRAETVKALINCIVTDIVLVCSELVCLSYMVKKSK